MALVYRSQTNPGQVVSAAFRDSYDTVQWGLAWYLQLSIGSGSTSYGAQLPPPTISRGAVPETPSSTIARGGTRSTIAAWYCLPMLVVLVCV